MRIYRPAGQEFQFPCPVLELEPFEIGGPHQEIPASDLFHAASSSLAPLAQTTGLVAGANRLVETWSAPKGLILKVTSGSDFFISAHGETIQRIGDNQPWPQLDREILVGPALILALALRNVWCLHASAITCNGRVLLFLGESGEGKSTLSTYLGSTGDSAIKLAADDILPVTLDEAGLSAWPHFPQLKLPLNTQPGPALPEKLPIGWICLLDTSDEISLQPLSPSDTVQIILRHTAGTRLLPPELLASHLTFCAQAASKIRMFQLSYPRRMNALPQVKKLLDTLC